MAVKGNMKIHYAWTVKPVGNNVQLQTVVGGYLLDALVAAGAYPAADGSAITSENTAVAQCMAQVRRFQSQGFDAKGIVTAKSFGSPADSPILAPSAKTLAEHVMARVDTPEKGWKQRISLANRSATGNGPALAPESDEDIIADNSEGALP